MGNVFRCDTPTAFVLKTLKRTIMTHLSASCSRLKIPKRIQCWSLDWVNIEQMFAVIEIASLHDNYFLEVASKICRRTLFIGIFLFPTYIYIFFQSNASTPSLIFFSSSSRPLHLIWDVSLMSRTSQKRSPAQKSN